jgi:spermidine synthase
MAEARDRWLLGAFVLSGAAGLGYEILWTRLLALALGSETLGVLGVLAGFFGGMAIGAAALHDRARRSADPVRLFMILELIAAGFAVLSPLWLHALAGWLPGAVGPLAGDNDGGPALALSLGVAAVVLLPGTFCLGATLPALVEARRRTCPADPEGRGLGRLYAANTAGAVMGVLVTVHVLLPTAGMVGGAAALAALGAGAAAVARHWAKTIAPTATATATSPAPEIDASKDPDAEVAREPWLLLALLAGTGLAGVGLEVVTVQILSQVLENTIFTFAHVLAVYLLGTAIGAALYTRHAAHAIGGRPATVAAALILAHGVATIWAASMLGEAPGLLDGIAGEGASARMEMLAEAVVATVVLGPATLLMGALFCHVAGLLAPRGIGRAYALNTLGGAVAPFAFGVWAIESLGYRDALFAVVYAYLALFGAFTWFRRFKRVLQIAGILGVVLLTAVAPSSLLLSASWKGDKAYVDDDWEVIESRETLLGAVIVSEYHPSGTAPPGPPLRRLQVGKHFRMGGKLAFGERRMGEIPLLLHPEPRRALFLGVGTGATLGAVRNHPSLEHIDAVELVPAVLDQLHHFRDINGGITDDERVHLHAADARRFVAASHEQYDVIVADLFHPGQDGAGNLYAIEHFENVRRNLAPGGVFGQWLPLYQLDAQMLRVIARTFLEAFDEVHVLLGIYNVEQPAIVLVGHDVDRSEGPLVIDVDQLSRRLQAPVYRELLMDPRDLLGAYLLDRPALVDFVGAAGINSDLMPRVSTHAPRSAYEESSTRGRDNLLELLEARRPVPPGLPTAADATSLAAFLTDVAAHAEALGCYLHGESMRLDTPGMIPGLVAATGHYLEAYRVAPQFRPARGMLLQAARAADDLAERIFPVMLERTPDERLVWREYLAYLRRSGDTARLQRASEEARMQLGLPDAAQP